MISYTYKISQLYAQDSGACERHNISTHFTLDNNVLPLNFELTLFKTEHSIVAVIENLEIEAELGCSKCLKKFSQPILIKSAEREFLFEQPREVEDKNDLFIVDFNRMQIDLEETLRQEMLLHFPLIPLCSSSCKGLCHVCGKNQNKEKCKHPKAKKVSKEVIKPLSQLKNLIP